MAKASVAGAVKTRLVPPLTPDEAAALNSACLADVAANIERASGIVPIRGFAAYSPAGSERFFRDLLPPDFGLLPSREATLGRSLHQAAQELLIAGYPAVCLVNGDGPTLPAGFLVEAVHRLGEPGDRVVLGPAADGGYYLIGLKRFHPRLFEEIDWSTERVFSQTAARAAEIGLELSPLPKWYDVDDAASLAVLGRELGLASGAPNRWRGGSAAPATAALLRAIARNNARVRRLFATPLEQ